MLASTRRDFLRQAALGLTAASFVRTGWADQQPPRRPRVAAIYTVAYHRSHAHVLLENFLLPYLFNGQRTDPGVDVVSLYTDQRAPEGDMTDDISRRFRIPVFRTIADALTLGTDALAVDAVLAIGEHGNYPVNDLGQREYPRKRFFDEIVAVMRRSRRYVPLFNDKHLSYRWDWAKEMYDTALELGIPLMAGSSVPLAQRRPPLEIASGTPLEEAVAIHGGPREIYDFHGLEILQSIVEFRRGGETGVQSVEFWEGEALWNAARQNRWNRELAEAAMTAELGQRPASLTRLAGENGVTPHGIHITYKDGFQATVLKMGRSAIRWNIAYKIANEPRPRATSWYVGPWENRNLFKALAHAIQHCFRRQHAPYPVERTLLTTGILEAAMRSRARPGQALATPHLEFGYIPRDFSAFREMGATWRIITEQIPQPRGITQVGIE